MTYQLVKTIKLENNLNLNIYKEDKKLGFVVGLDHSEGDKELILTGKTLSKLINQLSKEGLA